MSDMAPGDVAEIVKLFKDIELGFMSRMPDPLINLYFRNIARCDDFECRVSKEKDKVIALYVIITNNISPRYAPFLVSPFKFILFTIIYVTPLFIIFRYLLLSLKTSKKQKACRSKYDSELIYIGIRKNEQRKGLGNVLMRDMRRVLEKKGVSFLGLEYFKTDEQADRFYQKYDHEKLGELETGGRPTISLRIPLGNLPT